LLRALPAFMTTMTGMVTGLATLIAAIAALIRALRPRQAPAKGRDDRA
jgi:hypothetical protein